MNTLPDIVRELSRRGPMYLGNDPSIAKVAGFLNGWLHGRGGDAAREGNAHLESFLHFTAEEYDLPSNHGWEAIIVFVADDGKAGVGLFYDLFESYLSKIDK